MLVKRRNMNLKASYIHMFKKNYIGYYNDVMASSTKILVLHTGVTWAAIKYIYFVSTSFSDLLVTVELYFSHFVKYFCNCSGIFCLEFSHFLNERKQKTSLSQPQKNMWTRLVNHYQYFSQRYFYGERKRIFCYVLYTFLTTIVYDTLLES